MALEEIRVSGKLSRSSYDEFSRICQLLEVRRRDAVSLAVESWVAAMSLAEQRLLQLQEERHQREREDLMLGVHILSTLPGD